MPFIAPASDERRLRCDPAAGAAGRETPLGRAFDDAPPRVAARRDEIRRGESPPATFAAALREVHRRAASARAFDDGAATGLAQRGATETPLPIAVAESVLAEPPIAVAVAESVLATPHAPPASRGDGRPPLPPRDRRRPRAIPYRPAAGSSSATVP